MVPDTTNTAENLMAAFAENTGLDPVSPDPVRYLWTDAFAVCNYLGFFRRTGDVRFRELAERLIAQVHGTLGRFRPDDARTGWISGLHGAEAAGHPTAGGLRIGKPLPERCAGEACSEEEEWDRDGQYFHYLTRWMHALMQAGLVTGNRDYTRWAVELARTAHDRFTYPAGGRNLMYWKMSTDLSRPLVASMGQHDPLDGLVTCTGLQRVCGGDILEPEIRSFETMIAGMPFGTTDPLGIGGLLVDSLWIARVQHNGARFPPGLLFSVVSAAGDGLASFSLTRSLVLPAEYRLAFRELGLSTGLAAAARLQEPVARNALVLAGSSDTAREVSALCRFMPVRDRIDQFWLCEDNRAGGTWSRYRDINTVMLATSICPDGYLGDPDPAAGPGF